MKKIIIIYTTSVGGKLSNALILAKIHCQCRAVAEHPAERIGKNHAGHSSLCPGSSSGAGGAGLGGPSPAWGQHPWEQLGERLGVTPPWPAPPAGETWSECMEVVFTCTLLLSEHSLRNITACSCSASPPPLHDLMFSTLFSLKGVLQVTAGQLAHTAVTQGGRFPLQPSPLRLEKGQFCADLLPACSPPSPYCWRESCFQAAAPASGRLSATFQVTQFPRSGLLPCFFQGVPT